MAYHTRTYTRGGPLQGKKPKEQNAAQLESGPEDGTGGVEGKELRRGS